MGLIPFNHLHFVSVLGLGGFFGDFGNDMYACNMIDCVYFGGEGLLSICTGMFNMRNALQGLSGGFYD